MAIAIGADADIQSLRIPMKGGFNETTTKVISVGGTADDTSLEQFYTDWDAVSAALMVVPSVSGIRLVTGAKSAIVVDAESAMVNNQLVLTFFQVHPLNPLKEITKTVQIPAPVIAARTSAGAPNVASVVGDRSTADENLRGIINFLASELVYVAVDDSVTVGGWTYDPTRSGYVAAPAVLDGQ